MRSNVSTMLDMLNMPTPHPPVGTVRIEKPLTLSDDTVVWVLTKHHFTEVQAVAYLRAHPHCRRALTQAEQ